MLYILKGKKIESAPVIIYLYLTYIIALDDSKIISET